MPRLVSITLMSDSEALAFIALVALMVSLAVMVAVWGSAA